MDKAVTRKELDLQGSKDDWLVTACKDRYGNDGFIDGAARFALKRPPRFRSNVLDWTPQRTPTVERVSRLSLIGGRA